MENQKKWIIALVIAIVFVVLGGIGLYVSQVSQTNGLRQEITSAISQLSAQIEGLKTQQVADLKTEPTMDSLDQNTADSSDSSPVVVPEGFRSYVNGDLGFVLNIPIQVRGTDKQLNSIEIIESGNVVFLTYKSNYYYAEALKRSKSSLSDIEKTKGIPWGIMVRTVNSEQDLLTLIKNRYGSGCSIGSQKQNGDTGTYRIMIKGDGLDLDKTKCPVNYITAIEYSPSLKKVAIWDIGQDVSFIKLVDNQIVALDDEMINSFRFTK